MRPTSCCRRGLSAAFLALPSPPSRPPPRAPRRAHRARRARAKAIWTPADKHGFGTATATRSKVWYTLAGGELTEVYYPDLGTPALRDLQFVVTDGRTFADRESDATTQPSSWSTRAA